MNENPKEIIASYWSAVAPTYNKKLGHGLHSLEEKVAWQETLQGLLPAPPASVLDVGMGTGFLSLLLYELGYQVSGLDIAYPMIHTARSDWTEKEQANMVLGDAELLPFPSNEFDIIVSRFLIWTLPRPDSAVDEWTRICRPGGVVMTIEGLWWQHNLLFRLRWALGTLLEKWHDRNLQNESRPIFEDYYRPSVQKSLPLLERPGTGPIKTLFSTCGLTDVSVHKLSVVKNAEQFQLPLRRKLMYQDRYVILGSKNLG